MGTTARALGSAALVVVLAGGAYTVADAYDAVPGLLTLAAPEPAAAPFPTPAAATAPAAVPAALPALDPAAPVPAAAPVQALVDDLVSDDRMGPSVGVVVADALTGTVLATSGAEAARTPASVQKVVTAVAALEVLDPASTLTTTVVRGTGDRVVLVGGGDMMLGAGAGDPDAVVGHAGLADLAAQTARALALEGVGEVEVVYDASLFTGPLLSPQWDPADVAAGYVAPVTPLAVDIAKLGTGEYPPRSTNPAAAAARAFAERLREAGVQVADGTAAATAPEGARTLASVESAPLRDVVSYFLDTSDNTITEVVSRLVALEEGLPASFDGATQAVVHVLVEAGLDTSDVRLVDASGLGAGSAMPADLVTALLLRIVDPAHPELREVAAGMPIGGLTGTLADRYSASEARGLVRAKTGSLPHVTALAGTVLDADGRQLVFAVLADATPDGGQWPPRAAIDGFVTDLAACGCAG